jgi:putative flippase GtrA
MKTLSKFVLFCIVGGLAFLIDIGFVNLFFFFGLPFPIARAFSIFLALVFNFFVNRNFTFGAGDKLIRKQIGPYMVVYVIANLINLFSSILIVDLVGESILNINLASFIGTAISIPISFFGSLIWVFKRK